MKPSTILRADDDNPHDACEWWKGSARFIWQHPIFKIFIVDGITSHPAIMISPSSGVCFLPWLV